MRAPDLLLRDRIQLRRRLGPIASDITDIALMRVLRRAIGDVDLAFTALTMVPRPEWVQLIAGPLEPPRPTPKG